MFSYTKRRLWFWRLAHCLSILRCWRRVVLALVLLGVLAAVIVINSTTPVYTSRAFVETGRTNTDEMIQDFKRAKDIDPYF